MAVFRSYEKPKVLLRPVGIRRCKLVSWYLPYLYGSDVEFEAIVKSNSKRNETLKYEWILRRWDGQQRFDVNSGNGGLPSTEKSKRINVGYLSVTGHHVLDMKWGKDLSTIQNYTIMANFTLMDRDVYTVNWIYNLSSGIIGAIIGALIALAVMN